MNNVKLTSSANNNNNNNNNHNNNNININDSISEEKLSSTSSSSHPHIEWGEDHENILVEWADKAMCYRWLHSKCRDVYYKANTLFTIPVIIMSTIAGTANFAQKQFSESVLPYAVMGIGAINLLAGILTTIQQFLKISELNEAHRVATIAWDKFYRNIKVELSKSPNERIPVSHIIKHSKEEYDRLMETCPQISEDVINEFIVKFSVGKIKDGVSKDITDNHMRLKTPEICDALESTRLSVFKGPKGGGGVGVGVGTGVGGMTRTMMMMNQPDSRLKNERINSFIEHFKLVKKRDPTKTEIIEELSDEISIDFLEKYIEEITTSRIVGGYEENIVIDID